MKLMTKTIIKVCPYFWINEDIWILNFSVVATFIFSAEVIYILNGTSNHIVVALCYCSCPPTAPLMVGTYPVKLWYLQNYYRTNPVIETIYAESIGRSADQQWVFSKCYISMGMKMYSQNSISVIFSISVKNVHLYLNKLTKLQSFPIPFQTLVLREEFRWRYVQEVKPLHLLTDAMVCTFCHIRW
jgi:hypothetical protein